MSVDSACFCSWPAATWKQKVVRTQRTDLVVMQCTSIQGSAVSFRLLDFKAATAGAAALLCTWANCEASNYSWVLQPTPPTTICSLPGVLCICSFMLPRIYVLSLPFTRTFPLTSVLDLFVHIFCLCFCRTDHGHYVVLFPLVVFLFANCDSPGFKAMWFGW